MRMGCRHVNDPLTGTGGINFPGVGYFPSEAGGPTAVTLANLGYAVMPVELQLAFSDGTTDLVRLPVEIWYLGDRYVYEDRSGKTLVQARVNPDGTFLDAIPMNDAWTGEATDTRREQAKTSATD